MNDAIAVWHGAVRWGDMDAYGHVNHAVFFRYLESARIACLETWCGAQIALPVLVVADIHCRYLAELVYPATVTVHTALHRLRARTMEIYAKIWQGEQLCAESTTVLLCIDPLRRRAKRLPDDFLSQMTRYAERVG
ncbi:MAG: thioesterase family protein [Cardiobacteriaceae bacterium]|nr:thioesterase family protein [Cardiobacteriaceae bacterium]